MIKRNRLLCLLSGVRGFDKPKVALEQYTTDAEMAADIIRVVAESEGGSLEGACVIDLGAGAGMLSIAAAAAGASFVLGVEIDPDAAAVCAENIEEAEMSEICNIVVGDALRLTLPSSSFDLALLNPPFGTKNNAGIDLLFVSRALSLVRPGGAVFSLHKTATRQHILNRAGGMGAQAEAVATIRWKLSQTYRFHKKKAIDIDVDLIRFVKKEERGGEGEDA